MNLSVLQPLDRLLVLVLIATAPFGLAHAQSLAEADTLITEGDYAEAYQVMNSLALTDMTSDQRVLAGQLWAEIGRSHRAVEALRPLTSEEPIVLDAIIALAQIYVRTDQLDTALELIDSALEWQPGSSTSHFVRGLILHRLGDRGGAQQEFATIVEPYLAGDLLTAFELTLAGIALCRMERFEEANEAFNAAVNLDPGAVDARLAWAELLLEKYRPDQTIDLTEEVLELNPNHPQAIIIRARARLEMNEAPLDLAQDVENVLVFFPELPEAHEFLALVELSQEQYELAEERLTELSQQYPNRLETLTLLAATHFLSDAFDAYSDTEERVFAINPNYAEFYVVVADYAGRALRFDDAVSLYEQALDIDDGYWRAFVGLGIGLSRQGDHDQAFEILSEAFENDPFDVRAYNLVRFYENTLSEYGFYDSDHIRFRFHDSERSVLEAYIPDLAEWSYEMLVERYGFEPDGPLSIEIFRDPETFAIRSSGSRQIDPEGICFGRVITAQSPNAGDFNWAETLTHELSHVFTFALSNARAPRWLSEGMADYDVSLLRPEWQREGELLVLAMVTDHSVPSIADLNQQFLGRGGLYETLAAYHLSRLVVEFLVERWGEEIPLQMLEMFAEFQTQSAVIVEVTDLDVESFDEAFSEYLGERLADLLETFEPNLDHSAHSLTAEFVSVEAQDAQFYAELARSELQNLRIDQFETAIDRALEIDIDNPLANYLIGVQSLRRRQLVEARAQLQYVLNLGYDGYSLRIDLATVARREGRVTDAIEHFRRAQAFYPRGAEPYEELADIYMRSGQNEEATDQLQQLVMLNQNDFTAVSRLLLLVSDVWPIEETMAVCQLGYHIDPFDGELHGMCGRLAVEQEDWTTAWRELNLEQQLGAANPPDTERLLLLLGEVLQTE